MNKNAELVRVYEDLCEIKSRLSYLNIADMFYLEGVLSDKISLKKDEINERDKLNTVLERNFENILENFKEIVGNYE